MSVTSRKRVGLIVNPVAGMGGSVGLKGTDGDMYEQALKLGATPVSPQRVREFLAHIRCRDAIHLLAAPGPMGADCAEAEGLDFDVVGDIGSQPAPEDTRAVAGEMLETGVELIVFAGGDGTARDIVDAVDQRVPVLAIPAGVKIYSSVFAFDPRAAAELLDAFADGAQVAEEEVLDIDEDAFRSGRLDSRHYGFLLTPQVDRLLQGGKESIGSTAEALEDLAAAVVEDMDPGTLYLLGPGTTVRAVADELEIDKTLLGVDAVLDGQLAGADLNERAILELLDQHRDAVIVVTPLGGNGFIFGRGNKQFTAEVLRRVGRENFVIVSDKAKLLQLNCLHVDTGDAALDEALAGYIDVVIGRDYHKLMRVQ